MIYPNLCNVRYDMSVINFYATPSKELVRLRSWLFFIFFTFSFLHTLGSHFGGENVFSKLFSFLSWMKSWTYAKMAQPNWAWVIRIFSYYRLAIFNTLFLMLSVRQQEETNWSSCSVFGGEIKRTWWRKGRA